MNARERTLKIKIGENLYIGNQNKVVIQSMCNIKTENVHEVVNQINECHKLGAEIMRVSVLDIKDAKAISKIKENILIPLVADIHFDYKLALEAINSGADAIRINPGNIGSIDHIKEIIDLAKSKNIPIRIGVNSGSMDSAIYNYDKKLSAKIMIESLKKHVKIFEDFNFYNLVLSIKSSDVIETIEANRLASKIFKYPLHIGLTEAGNKETALIRSSAALAPLLLDGIGDTIRISITGSPQDEIIYCKRLLNDLHILNNNPRLISCPTCGRTEVNLIDLADKILNYIEKNNKNITVAIMGCIVNGPGEGKNADLGLAGGKDYFLMFKKGKVYKRISEKNAYDELIKEINNF